MFHAQNCTLLSFQSFLCARQRCVKEVSFIQGRFDKIQGLLGNIQGLFKDLNKFFIFKDFSRVAGCFFKDYSRPVRTMIENQQYTAQGFARACTHAHNQFMDMLCAADLYMPLLLSKWMMKRIVDCHAAICNVACMLA